MKNSNQGDILDVEEGWDEHDRLSQDRRNLPTVPRVLDTQVGGGHYKDMAIQPVEFIVANNIPYREANAIKYICRHKNKNGKEDLIKAAHYLEMIIEEYVNDDLS